MYPGYPEDIKSTIIKFNIDLSSKLKTRKRDNNICQLNWTQNHYGQLVRYHFKNPTSPSPKIKHRKLHRVNKDSVLFSRIKDAYDSSYIMIFLQILKIHKVLCFDFKAIQCPI